MQLFISCGFTNEPEKRVQQRNEIYCDTVN